jgi:hypothetical protein
VQPLPRRCDVPTRRRPVGRHQLEQAHRGWGGAAGEKAPIFLNGGSLTSLRTTVFLAIEDISGWLF